MNAKETKVLPDFSNREHLYKALLYLYACQTSEEQEVHGTIEENGAGFNRIDADFLSSLAQWLQKTGFLTEKQTGLAAKKLVKYSGQLANGAWEHMPLPERAPRPGDKPSASECRPKSKNNGTLFLDEDGMLAFKPFVYPSKQIKDIAPFTWREQAWHAHTPPNPAVVAAIHKMFDPVEELVTVQQALHPEPVVLPDSIANHGTLFPFQKESVQFCLGAPHGMLALAPGLGKTACSIFAAQAAGAKRILVVSPLSLLYNWKREIAKWVGAEAAIVYRKQLPVAAQWTVTNYDTLRMHTETFAGIRWDCVILDESILLKSRKALRTKAVQELVEAAKPKWLWELSGAPTSRLLDDMWSQMNILQPRRFSSYWRFAKQYCHVEQNQWGWQILANKSGAEQQLQQDLADIFFARTQDQVLDLPEWIFDNLEVPMTPVQEKLYNEMEATFIADLGDGDQVVAPIVLTQLLRLVQIASDAALIGGKTSGAKFMAIKDLLEYEQLPAIVWVNFVDTAARLVEFLRAGGLRVEMLTGATAPEERSHIVDQLQSGKLDVLVAHPAVGKFGLTLTAAHTAIYMERSYNADDYYQSLHRVRRIGTTSSPHIIHLLSVRGDGSTTIDHIVDKILASRTDSSRKLTTGELRGLFAAKGA